MMRLYYMLKGHKPVVTKNMMRWAKWMEVADRHVAETQVTKKIRVSTVFLGLDHSFGEGDAPVLFETMVFGGAMDGWQGRSCTWEEAEKMHQNVCLRVRSQLAGSMRIVK